MSIVAGWRFSLDRDRASGKTPARQEQPVSNEAIISVENLSKRYQLGAARSGERYTALRDVIASKVRNLFRRSLRAPSKGEDTEEFWALRNVSFDVKRGEVLGIIGRNGAGKSTLLKILSRITEPTTGRISLKGRVASLLEVGTGFHPELTGRENIYLNGAILGMHRHEIKAKFDEIVAFAEVERFLDTPVKRYSSGMYVRLAFAVAAHLEPEVLVVDEVLAVGDAQFQKKCLGRMQQAATHEGRTILFVSHDLQAVRRLCRRCIVLNQGRMDVDTTAEEAIKKYWDLQKEGFDYSRRTGEGSIKINSIRLLDGAGIETDAFKLFEPLSIEFEGEAERDVSDVMLAACLNTPDNIRAASLYSSYYGEQFAVKKGRFVARCTVPYLRLMPGEYRVLSHVEARGILLDALSDICTIRVDLPRTSRFVTRPDQQQGYSIENFSWQVGVNV